MVKVRTLVPVLMLVPPLPISTLIGPAQAVEAAVLPLVAFLHQPVTISLTFAIVPRMIVLVVAVIDAVFVGAEREWGCGEHRRPHKECK